jgi:hypothetical protein
MPAHKYLPDCDEGLFCNSDITTEKLPAPPYLSCGVCSSGKSNKLQTPHYVFNFTPENTIFNTNLIFYIFQIDQHLRLGPFRRPGPLDLPQSNLLDDWPSTTYNFCENLFNFNRNPN